MKKQCNSLLRENKFDEAWVLACKMKDLDPDSPAVTAIIEISRVRKQLARFNSYAEERKQYFLDSMDDAEKVGKYPTMRNPIDFDPVIAERAKNRKGYPNGISSDLRGDKERRIEQKLRTPITLAFKDTPLNQVIDDLRKIAQVNVVADTAALEEAGVSLSQTLSLAV